MKKAKFLIFSFFLLFVIGVNGESYQSYLQLFEGAFPSIEVDSSEEENSCQMMSDLLETARQNNVLVFAPHRSTETILRGRLDFYISDPAVIEVFRSSYELEEKTYKSILLGTTEVRFMTMEEIGDTVTLTQVYFIGDDADIAGCIEKLNESYNIGQLRPGLQSNQSRNTTLVLFAILGLILLLWTLYDVSMQKKEHAIRLSLGEKAAPLVFKNMFADSVCLTALFFGSFLLLSPFTSVWFHFSVSLTAFGVLLVSGNLIFLLLFAFDWRRAFALGVASPGLLTASYTIKFVTAAITILMVASQFSLMTEALSYRRQGKFFKDHAEYSYIDVNFSLNVSANDPNIAIKSMEHAAKLTRFYETLYKEQFETADITLLLNVWNSSAGIDGVNAILCNKNTLPYLMERFPALFEGVSQEEITIFIPSSVRNRADYPSIANTVRSNISLRFTYDIPITETVYSQHGSVLVIDDQLPLRSNLCKDPIIIYNPKDESNLPLPDEWNGGYLRGSYNEILYKISEPEFLAFARKNGFDPIRDKITFTNAHELFQHNLSLLDRGLLISAVMSFLFLLLECVIIRAILRLEYQVNAMELCLKKVLGYSLWARNRFILLSTALTYLLGLGIYLLVAWQMKNPLFTMGAILLVFGIEMGTVFRYARKLDRVHIGKILKGGSL